MISTWQLHRTRALLPKTKPHTQHSKVRPIVFMLLISVLGRNDLCGLHHTNALRFVSLRTHKWNVRTNNRIRTAHTHSLSLYAVETIIGFVDCANDNTLMVGQRLIWYVNRELEKFLANYFHVAVIWSIHLKSVSGKLDIRRTVGHVNVCNFSSFIVIQIRFVFCSTFLFFFIDAFTCSLVMNESTGFQ